jgi:hypothetical protein
MTDRITERNLQGALERLNRAHGFNAEYAKNSEGRSKPIPNAFTLDYAYGGVQLQRHCESGGVRTISFGGYVTKRELWNQIQAIIAATNT